MLLRGAQLNLDVQTLLRESIWQLNCEGRGLYLAQMAHQTSPQVTDKRNSMQ